MLESCKWVTSGVMLRNGQKVAEMGQDSSMGQGEEII